MSLLLFTLLPMAEAAASASVADLEITQTASALPKLKDGPTVAEIAGRLNRFDEQTIRGFFPKARCGVEVAHLAENPAQALEVTTQQLFKALQLFRTGFDFILVDGLRGWEPLTLGVLDAADLVLMVCSPDLIGIRHERHCGHDDHARHHRDRTVRRTAAIQGPG